MLVGRKYDEPDRSVRANTVLAFRALYRLKRSATLWPLAGNRNDLSTRKSRTLTGGRRRLPSGSAFNTCVGIILPPRNSTCRASGAPRSWMKFPDTLTSAGSTYVPETLPTHSHVRSLLLKSTFGFHDGMNRFPDGARTRGMSFFVAEKDARNCHPLEMRFTSWRSRALCDSTRLGSLLMMNTSLLRPPSVSGYS